MMKKKFQETMLSAFLKNDKTKIEKCYNDLKIFKKAF